MIVFKLLVRGVLLAILVKFDVLLLAFSYKLHLKLYTGMTMVVDN